MPTKFEETAASLKRVQEFDAESLARREELGAALNFSPAVQPAARLVQLFRQIPSSSLDDFPDGNLEQVKQQADAVYNIFQSILSFSVEKQNNPTSSRQGLIDSLITQYPSVWGGLHHYIAYSAAKAADFQRLEREGRAAIQSIADRTAETLSELAEAKAQADEALAAARRAAAEQGVSQQAIYFRDEASAHDTAAEQWRDRTTKLAVAVGIYAAVSILLHKWAWLAPATPLESAQLITSKILIFLVLSYMLVLAAKNFLSHKHNAIVNKHRQNALMTFNALVAAANDPAAKDVILTHAAACIFSPQETGYSKPGGAASDSSIARALLGLATRSESKASVS